MALTAHAYEVRLQNWLGGRVLNLSEQVRGEVLRHSLQGASFARDWALRRRAILDHLGPAKSVSPKDVLGLGSRLSDLFVQQTRTVSQDRDQASVSGGGAVWDALVNLYEPHWV